MAMKPRKLLLISSVAISISSIAVAANSTILVSNGKYDMVCNLNGPLTGSGNITVIVTLNSGDGGGHSHGIYVYNANNSYSGAWTIATTTSETAILSAKAANASGTGSVTLGNRGTLEVNAANGINCLTGVSPSHSLAALNLTKPWTNASASLSLAAGTVNVGTAYSTVGTLNLGGNAAINSSGDNLSSNNTSPITISNAITLATPATLGNATDNGLLTLSAPVTLGTRAEITTDSDMLASAAISGSSDLAKLGTATLTRTGTNNYGSTYVDGGTLQVRNGGTTGSIAGTPIINGKVTWPMSATSTGVVETPGVSVEYTPPTGDSKRFARIDVTAP